MSCIQITYKDWNIYISRKIAYSCGGWGCWIDVVLKWPFRFRQHTFSSAAESIWDIYYETSWPHQSAEETWVEERREVMPLGILHLPSTFFNCVITPGDDVIPTIFLHLVMVRSKAGVDVPTPTLVVGSSLCARSIYYTVVMKYLDFSFES